MMLLKVAVTYVKGSLSEILEIYFKHRNLKNKQTKKTLQINI